MAADVRVAEALDPEEALRRVRAGAEGAVLFLVTTARAPGLAATPAPDAEARLEAACARALAAGATRALAWQAAGRVPAGAPVAVLAAAAPTRREARRALDLLTGGLKGVAAREDLE